MLGKTLLDRATNEWVRRKTGLRDAVKCARERRWRWLARLAGMDGDRWARAVFDWYPRGPTRQRGRPGLRWRDEFVTANEGAGVLRMAADKDKWQRLMALRTQ